MTRLLRVTGSIFLGKCLLLVFLTVIGMTVLGYRMGAAAHPFFSIVSVSQPFRTQRADAIYLVLFGMLCIFRLTLYTTLAAHLLRQMFQKLRTYYASSVCLAAMLAGVVICG